MRRFMTLIPRPSLARSLHGETVGDRAVGTVRRQGSAERDCCPAHSSPAERVDQGWSTPGLPGGHDSPPEQGGARASRDGFAACPDSPVPHRLALLAMALVTVTAVTGCDRWHYNRVDPGDLHGRLVVQWVDPDKFIFVPDSEKPLTFTRHNQEVISPGQMYTDGGSIPRPLWALRNYSPWGYAPAYIIHDWLFQMKHCELPGSERYTVEEAAWVLAEVMKTMMEKQGPDAVDKLTLYSVFEAVRSPIAAKLWADGPCELVTTRGGEPALPPEVANRPAKMEYTIEFP